MYRLLSDLELANALYKGDSLAFEELYTRHVESLLRLAMAKLGFEQDAEDCVQEVFCNFWQHCLDRQSPFLAINLEAYLVTATKHYVFRHYKKQLRSKLIKQQMAAATSYAEGGGEDRVAQQEITRLLQDELKDMPEQMRKVFEMSRRQHLSIQQIATELELSEQTVKNHMSRALHRLRVRLGPQLLSFFL